jgi:phenylacetate-CoA ligase
MSIRNLAKKLPYPIQQGIKYIYGIAPLRFRYSKVFWDTYNFLQESQWWSKEKLEEYQMKELQKLLHHAYENVPYYKRVFDERGLKPKDIKDFNDLKKLPYLTKDQFRKYRKDITIKDVRLKNLIVFRTSGTTGKPLQFYGNYSIIQREWAFIYHQWSRMGFKPGDSVIQLRGGIIESNRLTEYDPIKKVLRFSPQIGDKDTVSYYLRRMEQFGASFLHGYPSVIAIFASMIKKYCLSVPFKLKAVFLASEAIYPWEREVIQEIFNCKTFSHYGTAEMVILAGECEYEDHYHSLPQYSIIEIDSNTNEIIGTSLLNDINPFIRYRTTDIASQAIYSSCDKCGRNYFPVFQNIEGRLEDFIITPNNVPISPAVITHPFKDFKTIKNTQIIQKSLNHTVLKIVPWSDYIPERLEAETRQLRQGLQRILGYDMKIEVQIVEFLQLPKSGKFKWIISEVSKDSLEKGIRESRKI